MQITEDKLYININKTRYLRDFLNNYLSKRVLSAYKDIKLTEIEAYGSRTLYSLFRIAKTHYPSTTIESFNKAIVYNIKNKGWKFRICSTINQLVVSKYYILNPKKDKNYSFLIILDSVVGHNISRLNKSQYYNLETMVKLLK